MATEPAPAKKDERQVRRQTAAASPFVLPILQQAGNQTVSSVLAPPSAARPGPMGSGAANAVQRDVVSDVEDKMSYSLTDWAITDAEATDALTELAELSVPALAEAMSRLSQTAKTRLLDNLPDRAKHTSGYAKVLVAMGPFAVQPYVQSLLDHGMFGWATTEDDAAAVFQILAALQPVQQSLMAMFLGQELRQRLADHLDRGVTIGDPEHAALRALFDVTSDADVDTLKKWMHIRFRIDFGTRTSGGEKAEDWDAASLRRMYNVLQALPPGAVETDPELARIDRYKDPGPAGGYYASDGRIAIGYGNVRALGGVVNPDNPTGASMGSVPAPLQGQNMFDGVVRHEVGHAVDKRLGLSASYCIGKPSGGNWQSHGDGSGLALALVRASGGAIAGLPHVAFLEVTQVLQGIIDDRQPELVVWRLMMSSIWATLDPADQVAVLADPAIKALQICFADKNPGNPWYQGGPDGGIILDGRIYQESYAGQWWSYDPSTRARKVSSYQFRAPGEWIAEAYNAYYTPPTKGAGLAAIDPATKAWFDTNVDIATGGDGAAAPGPALPAPASGPGFPAPASEP